MAWILIMMVSNITHPEWEINLEGLEKTIMAKVTLTPEQFAARWETGMRGSGARIEQGVNGVTEAPGAKAAAQADLWLAKVTASRDKWAKNVAAVSLGSWKESMIKKGIPALQNAVGLAKPKVQAMASKLIPAINAAVDTLPPRGATLDENLLRVRHMAESLAQAFA